MPRPYADTEPARHQIDQLPGPAVLEFGTDWCGYCRAAQPLIESAMGTHDGVHHIKVRDGSGRPLGRSFGIKLWPTLIFLKDGREAARLVRPTREQPIREALERIAQPA